MGIENRLFSGNEHWVYETEDPNYLLKVQNRRNRFFFWLFRWNPNVIKTQYEKALDYEKFGVRIPESRIDITENGRNYQIYQRKIIEDGSVADIKGYLETRSITELAMRYISSPDNFVSCNSEVYLLDFTPGFWFPGLLDRLGVVDYRAYLKTKYHARSRLQAVLQTLSSRKT